MRKTAFTAGLAGLLLSTGSVADDHTLRDQLAACAQENMDAARLACYDALARVPAPVAEAPPPPAPTPAPATAPVAAATAATVEAAPAADPVAEFGQAEEVDEDELVEISAMATAVKKRPAGQLLITLDNGQTWTEKDHEANFRVKVGDTLRIKKGRFGGYTMYTEYRRSSKVTRVQ